MTNMVIIREFSCIWEYNGFDTNTCFLCVIENAELYDYACMFGYIQCVFFLLLNESLCDLMCKGLHTFSVSCLFYWGDGAIAKREE